MNHTDIEIVDEPGQAPVRPGAALATRPVTPAVQTVATQKDGFVPYRFPEGSPCLRPARRFAPSPKEARKMYMNPHFDELPDSVRAYYLCPDPVFRDSMTRAPIVAIERLEWEALPKAVQSRTDGNYEIIVVYRLGCRGPDWWARRSGKWTHGADGPEYVKGYQKIANGNRRR